MKANTFIVAQILQLFFSYFPIFFILNDADKPLKSFHLMEGNYILWEAKEIFIWFTDIRKVCWLNLLTFW